MFHELMSLKPVGNFIEVFRNKNTKQNNFIGVTVQFNHYSLILVISQ